MTAGPNANGDAALRLAPGERLVIGVDVGSTTVKTAALGARSRAVLWSRYERHETRQAERVLSQLEALQADFGAAAMAQARIFVTGSGSGPVTVPLGAKFVQEVNAVAVAVETLHPEVGSVVELGGQDAKIIVYKTNPATGEKHVEIFFHVGLAAANSDKGSINRSQNDQVDERDGKQKKH